MGISLVLAKLDVAQIVLIVFIALLVIAYPILITRRNKKENTKLTEQTNSLKRGDKVLTTSGVYGTIVDLQLENDKKIVTIETGTEKKRGYISVDAYAIYTVFPDDSEAVSNNNDANNSGAKTDVKADSKSKQEPAKIADKTETQPAEVVENSDVSVEDVKAQISGKKSKNK